MKISPHFRSSRHSFLSVSFLTFSHKMGIRCGVLQGHSEEVLDCVINKNGTLILSGGEDDTLRLWSVARCM